MIFVTVFHRFSVLSVRALFLACHLACASPTQPEGKLGEEVKFRVGEVATFDGDALRVLFDRVTDDSRCPVGTTCVWEGDAIAWMILTLGRETATLQLHTHPNFVREGIAAGYRVRLVTLSPLPEADRRIDPQAYVVSVVVERVA